MAETQSVHFSYLLTHIIKCFTSLKVPSKLKKKKTKQQKTKTKPNNVVSPWGVATELSLLIHF